MDRVRDRPSGHLGERRAFRIVGVDEAGRARRQHLEQPPLGLEVGLHVHVEIQMIAGQVGEHAGRERRPIHAPEGQRVGRHLHHAGSAPAIDHLAQQFLDVRSFGCRPRGLANLVADPVGDRSQHAATDSRCLEDRREHICGGRLAVGTGDADDAHLIARVAFKPRRKHGHRQACIRDLRPRHRGVRRSRMLGHDRGRTALNRLAHEGRAVGVHAFERDEHLARRDGSRVVGNARHRRVRGAAREPAVSIRPRPTSVSRKSFQVMAAPGRNEPLAGGRASGGTGRPCRARPPPADPAQRRSRCPGRAPSGPA